MTFLFAHVCDLLSTLEAHHLPANGKARTSDELRPLYKPHLASWFTYFRPDLTPEIWLALFSLLWPEGRPDRVYGFKEEGLISAVVGAMCLGTGRADELRRWRTGGRGDQDLGECIERVFAMAENIVLPSNAVTIAEVESILDELAAHCRFSSSDIRASRDNGILKKSKTTVPTRQFLLGSIYQRLSSRDAKWFTRILLKTLLPVSLDHEAVFREFHFLLPEIWRVRGELKSALALLGSKTFKLFPCKPSAEDEDELRDAASRLLMPEIGVKVGRPVFIKALSCDQVLRTVGKSTWAMERKYDGEYCQIHIDLTKGKDWLKIYSKSGRDSTQDRAGCHSIIRECLQLDSPNKRIVKQKCILEAEFLVYSNKDQQIASFHAIRNHVTRSGTYIGTSLSVVDRHRDSEHIMLKFFDCILLDDICTPISSYNARRHHLEQLLVKKLPNRAELATRIVVDFAAADSRATFLEAFAQGIGMKWEGFVMKPCDGSYVGWGMHKGNFWIKLKKDYIPGFGDSADFAIVGGRHGGRRGMERGLDSGTANTFYAACLVNKHDVVALSAKPIFKIVFTVSYNLTQADLKFLKSQRYFHSIEFSESHTAAYGLSPLDPHFPEPDFLFSTPPVIECFGAGFDKTAVSDYWTLRWPRVQKIHKDREYLEAVTFQELQEMGRKAMTVSADIAAEVKEWEQKLKSSVRKGKDKHTHNPKGMLARSFWQADSPTTELLDTVHWALSSVTPPASGSQSHSATERSSAAAKRKRPLSQISGNNMSPPAREVESRSPRRAISTSPLFSSPVYLMECLSDKAEVQELFDALGISRRGSCKDLAGVAGHDDEGSEIRKRVLLVEERRREDMRSLVGRLSRASAELGLVVDVYSWRILKKMKRVLDCAVEGTTGLKRRRTEEDWSVMHLDTIC
ncbi:hypothetical protein Dda_4117 [Drechslerella dactyloides]|uniref:ATP-dependent DNA ligase family profile domain-containing protein n=1 Tax=Drechslerella dactyloides TaxID=74499 RepID=A0AAD6J3L4_DREDA|nr:hypothetical protein Dda_4117 [Drechslerella dactyloides]